jgi:hypothetical protein
LLAPSLSLALTKDQYYSPTTTPFARNKSEAKHDEGSPNTYPNRLTLKHSHPKPQDNQHRNKNKTDNPKPNKGNQLLDISFPTTKPKLTSMDFAELRKIIEQNSKDILNEPGEVFFGSPNSLKHPNGIALVGLNPGGSGLPSIQENLTRYEREVQNPDFSGFLDQCWHEPYYSRYERCPRCTHSLETSGIVHQDRHQKMVSRIADFAGFDLRETIALNAIWIQTRSAADLRHYLKSRNQRNMSELFKSTFFPTFRELFKRTNTRLIICLGNGVSESSFEFFRNALNVNRDHIDCLSDNYRDGRYFEIETDGVKRTFFGIPHPSLHITGQQGLLKLREILTKMRTWP